MITVRELSPDEFGRVADIDRTEHIDALVAQRGTELTSRDGSWDAAPWDPNGDGEHSVAAQRRAIGEYAAAGGTVLGAFCEGRLIGIGAVVPHLRPAVAQLAYLHVSREARSAGVGRMLSERLDEIAHSAGATEIVVSATPSANTVRFYLGRGYRPLAEPLPELFAREPDDVHLAKPLGDP